MSEPSRCAIIFTPFGGCEPVDDQGCIRELGHDGPHLFKGDDGKMWNWETDYGCNCEECKSDDCTEWCKLYWEAKDEHKPTAKKIVSRG